MQSPAMLLRTGAISLTLALVTLSPTQLQAQTVPEVPPAKSASPDELSQAELLKSYLHVREQLHAAELAIVNNRLEAEATARAQAAAITEKLDTIKSVIATERELQQIEARRATEEQERQQIAARETNRIILWVSVAFGGVGLLTMFATTLLQWRGIKRMAEVTAQHHLPSAPPQGWLAVGNSSPSGETVALSNQRLMSVIDRMERRIFELEHTASSPLPATSVEATVESNSVRNAPAAASDQAARISALLGKGRSLLNTNKAREAIACYDEILAIDAQHPEALVKKGSALERLKQDLAAIECYDRAIKADRNMALAYLSKGGVFNRLQRFDEAVACYEQALQVEKEGKPTSIARVSVSGDWPASGSTMPA